MRSHLYPSALLLVAAATAALLAACSSPQPTEPRPTAPSSPPPLSAPPGPGVSAGGVTTAVDAPANSTETEYYEACHSALTWMSERGEDPRSLIEPYLAMVQQSATAQPGTWNIPWAELSAERQSAVIVAVTAAADGGCG